METPLSVFTGVNVLPAVTSSTSIVPSVAKPIPIAMLPPLYVAVSVPVDGSNENVTSTSSQSPLESAPDGITASVVARSGMA